MVEPASEIVCVKDRRKWMANMVALSGMLILCVFLILLPLFTADDRKLTGVMMIAVLFLPITAAAIYEIWKLWGGREHKIKANDEGIVVDEFSTEAIPWRNVRKFRVDLWANARRGHNPQVLVVEVNRDAVLESKSFANRISKLYHHEIELCNIRFYACHADELVESLHQQLKRHKEMQGRVHIATKSYVQ